MTHYFEKVSLFTGQFSHTRLVLQNTVTRNTETIWLLVLYDVLVHMTFERNDGIWISDIHRDRIPQLCSRYWDSFLSRCCSSIIYNDIRVVSSYSLWYLVSEDTFESAETYRFLYTKDASFSRKILLKLIHFKSPNSGVTWSRFKYFSLLATLVAKLIHFCTSYCSFSLHLPHIELQ